MTLQFTTQQLEYLVATSQFPSWAEAAQSLGVTPSALSQGLAELERRVGLSLFDRQGRKRELTSHGTEILAYAQRMLATTTDLAQWVDGAKKGQRGRIHIGMIDVAAVYHYAETLTAFRLTHPDVELRLTVAPSGSLLQQLEDGKLDATVMVAPPRVPTAIETQTVFTEELAIYAPKGANVGAVESWGPWVSFPAASFTRRLVAAALADRGAEFRVESESNQPEVLRRMVMLGMGWTVLPVIQAEADPTPLERALPEPLVERSLVLGRRLGSRADAATKTLLDLLGASAD